MVESPGTAPGSEPFITGAFIAIVRASPNKLNIGAGGALRKGAMTKVRIGEEFGLCHAERAQVCLPAPPP